MSRAISMVLIDDNLAEHEMVVARIRAQPGFQVLATLAEVEVALEVVQALRPDVVLLNLRPEGDDSLTLAGALHGESPESRVIMMGLHPRQKDLTSLVRAGVSGFIMSGASYDEFVRTLRSVASGIQVLPLELTRALFGQLSRHSLPGRPKRTLHIKRLTLRERQVADLIIEGCSNKQIGARMRISVHTVKCHVHALLSKLALNSRLEVAALSHQGVTGVEPRRRRALAAT